MVSGQEAQQKPRSMGGGVPYIYICIYTYPYVYIYIYTHAHALRKERGCSQPRIHHFWCRGGLRKGSHLFVRIERARLKVLSRAWRSTADVFHLIRLVVGNCFRSPAVVPAKEIPERGLRELQPFLTGLPATGFLRIRIINGHRSGQNTCTSF